MCPLAALMVAGQHPRSNRACLTGRNPRPVLDPDQLTEVLRLAQAAVSLATTLHTGYQQWRRPADCPRCAQIHRPTRRRCPRR